MNANRLRKKNKVNGLNPTFRNKMNYIAMVDQRCNFKHYVSVVNWKPYTLIALSGWLPRVNNEVD
jgi:hypothetical protein